MGEQLKTNRRKKLHNANSTRSSIKFLDVSSPRIVSVVCNASPRRQE